jgi:hypothetical protein
MTVLTDPPKPNQVNGTYREPPPSNKDVHISLLFLHAPGVGFAYQVKSVTNTVWYKPGDWLTESVVAEICKIPRWTIAIDSYELMKKLFDTLPKISIL